MKNRLVTFNIKAKAKEIPDKDHVITFMAEYDANDNWVDGYSFNPLNGWADYNNWHQGWSEMDSDLEVLLGGISHFSNSDNLNEIVGEMVDDSEIGSGTAMEYEYDNKHFTFEVICCDIEWIEGDD